LIVKRQSDKSSPVEQDAANQAQKTRELEARVKELTATVEDLKSTLAWFRRNMFGRKSEQMPNAPEEQALLELEDSMIDKAARSAPEKKAKGGSRKRRQTRAMRLPLDLPVKEETIIPLAVQEAPEKWRRISQEVTERLEMEPGKLFLKRTIRPTFVSLEEPFAAPVTSPAPVALVEGQFFGASLLAELCLDKFLSTCRSTGRARLSSGSTGSTCRCRHCATPPAPAPGKWTSSSAT
jgi:hypothetical protein